MAPRSCTSLPEVSHRHYDITVLTQWKRPAEHVITGLLSPRSPLPPVLAGERGAKLLGRAVRRWSWLLIAESKPTQGKMSLFADGLAACTDKRRDNPSPSPLGTPSFLFQTANKIHPRRSCSSQADDWIPSQASATFFNTWEPNGRKLNPHFGHLSSSLIFSGVEHPRAPSKSLRSSRCSGPQTQAPRLGARNVPS